MSNLKFSYNIIKESKNNDTLIEKEIVNYNYPNYLLFNNKHKRKRFAFSVPARTQLFLNQSP